MGLTLCAMLDVPGPSAPAAAAPCHTALVETGRPATSDAQACRVAITNRAGYHEVTTPGASGATAAAPRPIAREQPPAAAAGPTTTTAPPSPVVVTGDSRPLSPAGPAGPAVAISASTDPSVLAGPASPCNDVFLVQPSDGQVRLSRTGDSSGRLTVSYSLGGTARLGVDYVVSAPPGSVDFLPGQSSATITFSPHAFLDGKTIAFNLVAGAGYQIGGGGSVTLTIHVSSTGFGCGPPTFTDATTNTEQTIRVGQGLVALRASPFPGTSVRYSMESGRLPPGLTLHYDGTFAGTAQRSGDYQAMIGACTPAFVPPGPPSRTPTCAVTRLRITVTEPQTTSSEAGPEAALPLTGAAPATTVFFGLFLVVAGAAIIAFADRGAR